MTVKARNLPRKKEAASSEEVFRARVSRETLERLEIYHDLLLRWQHVKNLVSRNTLDAVWNRHFMDSAQILDLAPSATGWVDLGSGGGFPGMVVAILKKGLGQACEMHLVESDHRKCAFLREVSRETGAGALVHCARIEDVIEDLPQIDVVTARALASMQQLIAYSMPLLQSGAMGIFLKGQDVDAELTKLPKYSMLDIVLRKSDTDSTGTLVVVKFRNTAVFRED